MKINSKFFMFLSFVIFAQYSVFSPCLRADVSKNADHPESGQSDSSLLEESKTKSDILPAIMPIKFETVPKGAQLEIDDKIKVNTPKTVLLKEGNHTIKISKEGYTIINKTINIKGDVRRYFYKLQSQKEDPVIVPQAEEGNIIMLVNSGRWDEVVKIGDPAVDVLVNNLKNSDWNKRAKIAEALGKIGRPKAIVPLTGLLHDDHVEVRKNAVIALGKIGNDQAIEPLREAATKDRHSDIKAISMEILKNMKGYTQEKYIADIIALQKWEELLKIGNPAVDALISTLKDADLYKRANIAEVLGKIKNNKATVPLFDLLTDKDAEVRKRAVIALGEIGDSRAIEPLRKVATMDNNPDIKSAADDVLKKLPKEALSIGKPHISDEDGIKRILSCINESIQLRDIDKFCQFLSKEDNNFYSSERKKMEDFIKEIHVVNSTTDNVDINIEGNTANVQYTWSMDCKWKSSGGKEFKNKLQISLKLKKNGNNWEIFQVKGMSSIASAETSGAKPKPPSMLDTIPPKVSSVSPVHGTTDVMVDTSITITFSEAMDASTLNTSNIRLSGGTNGTISYNLINKTATFIPSSNLNYSTTYTTTVTTGVKDVNGNVMSANYTWSFTTISKPSIVIPQSVSTTYCQQCKEDVGTEHICDLTFFCHDCKKEVGDGHICGVTAFCRKCEEETGTGHICDVTYFCYDCEKEVGDEHICGVTHFCHTCKAEVGEGHICGRTYFCFDCEKEMPKEHNHGK